jgi:outer membrane receptor protein involved in Fe transport
MKDLRLICSCLLLAVATASMGFSQAVNATIVGSISDASGASVAGAKVTITETNTGNAHIVTANESGGYTLPDIPAGIYAVMVEHPGFKKEERRNIEVLTNSTTRVDLQLQPGNVSETIEVTGAPPALQTDRADTGRTIDTQMVDEMPLSGNRNFQNLLDLVPGTSVETEQHSQFFNASGSLQTNVNGQPRMGNNYQIEGIDDNERTGLLQILIPPIEAIQSVGVSVTNHDPELGRATGAVVNVMLKSGTNGIHGAAYEFIENSDLNARSFFNPSVGHVAYNYFGGNIGGPIKKNKLFYFADYLRQSDHEANTNLVTLPSAAFRTGNLTADPNHLVYDPSTGNAITGVGRVPFAGNIIPTSRINPVSAAVLAALPEPNQPFNAAAPANNYFELLPFHKDTNFVDGKVDYVISDKDRFSSRFSFQDPTIFQAPLFGNLGGNGNFSGTGSQKTYSTGLNYDRIVTPTLVTEFRFGVAYYHNQAVQSDYGLNDSTAIGINGVNLNSFTTGFAGISVGGFSQLTGYSASLPWDRAEANIDLVNSWTKTWKNHTIKWGADLRILRDALLQDQTYSPRGIIYFGTNQTSIPSSPGGTGIANDMASFLLDAPYQEGRDVNTYFPSLHQKQLFLYVADNWQVSSKFTVNLGVRWEYYAPPTPEFPGGFSNYDTLNNTLVLAGIGGNASNMGLQSQYHYFAPRLGIAYRLNDKTVIRAGFGISYTPFPDNNWAYNFPVRSNNLYSQAQGNSYAQAALPSGLAPTFQNGFPAPDPVVVPSNGIITNPNPTSAEIVIPTNYKNGYVEAYNLAIQRVLPYSFTLDVAFVGNHGVDIVAATNLNAGTVIGAGNAGQPYYNKYGITNSITQYFQGFSSNFNSLQVKLDRSFNHGFRVTNSFTWQKAMDFQRGDDSGLDFYAGQGLSRNYARADFDRTLNMISSFIYQLPFGKGKPYLTNSFAGKIAGGWQIAGVLSWRTGVPLTFTSTTSLSLGSGGTSTAQQVGPIIYYGGINTGNPWFSTQSFKTTATNVQGNTGINIYSGPDLFSLNTNLSRTIAIKERLQMQIRFECFNVTNTPAFSTPNTEVGTSGFGYITSTLNSSSAGVTTGAGIPRVVQAGVRFTF